MNVKRQRQIKKQKKNLTERNEMQWTYSECQARNGAAKDTRRPGTHSSGGTPGLTAAAGSTTFDARSGSEGWRRSMESITGESTL